LLRAPRTDPCEPDSGTRLPPRVHNGKAPLGPRMKNARSGQPGLQEPRHPLPSSPRSLAPAHQCALPELSDAYPEDHQGPIIRRHRVVGIEAPDYLPQPCPLFRDRLVTPSLQFALHSLDRGLQPVASGPPQKLEAARTFLPADHREAQKVEGLRLTQSTFLPIEGRKAAEPKDPCLFRVYRVPSVSLLNSTLLSW